MVKSTSFGVRAGMILSQSLSSSVTLFNHNISEFLIFHLGSEANDFFRGLHEIVHTMLGTYIISIKYIIAVKTPKSLQNLVYLF